VKSDRRYEISMSKEKIAELKIKIPARWLDFIEECYEVTGMDRDEDLLSWTKCRIEMFMDKLDAKDLVRLTEKYQLTDIREIPQCVRDEAAGIPHKVEPETDDPMREVARVILKNPKFKEAFNQYQKSAETDSFIKALDVLSPEERAELRAVEAKATALGV
jgi:DNA-binding Lrp family transcriptional regulator